MKIENKKSASVLHNDLQASYFTFALVLARIFNKSWYTPKGIRLFTLVLDFRDVRNVWYNAPT